MEKTENLRGPETQSKYALRNYMEDRVMEKAKEVMAKMGMCQCEKCFLDVCALALNRLPPIYVTTDRGNLIRKVPDSTKEKEVELTILITHCVKMVIDKPMH